MPLSENAVCLKKSWLRPCLDTARVGEGHSVSRRRRRRGELLCLLFSRGWTGKLREWQMDNLRGGMSNIAHLKWHTEELSAACAVRACYTYTDSWLLKLCRSQPNPILLTLVLCNLNGYLKRVPTDTKIRFILNR